MLPKIDFPTYTLKLPSSGKEISVRAFNVREEKLSLIASQSGDEAEIINTTKQIINNCMLSEKIDIDRLPFFDIDYIYIFLRAKSVSDSINVNFECNHVDDSGNRCSHVFPVKIDISDVEVINNTLSKTISLASNVSVKMKYPSYAVMKLINPTGNPIDNKVSVICASIDQIVDKDKVYTTKDFTQGELKEWVEKLTQEQFKKLELFIDNFPSFHIKTKATCPRCSFEHEIIYDDFTAFFL